MCFQWQLAFAHALVSTRSYLSEKVTQGAGDVVWMQAIGVMTLLLRLLYAYPPQHPNFHASQGSTTSYQLPLTKHPRARLSWHQHPLTTPAHTPLPHAATPQVFHYFMTPLAPSLSRASHHCSCPAAAAGSLAADRGSPSPLLGVELLPLGGSEVGSEAAGASSSGWELRLIMEVSNDDVMIMSPAALPALLIY